MGDTERRAAEQEMQDARTQAASDLQSTQTAFEAMHETDQALATTEQAIAAHQAANF